MTRGVANEGYRALSRLIVKRVIARGQRKGWDVDKTAAVIVLSLSPARVKAGVVGPCFYCGDDLAATVDHLRSLAKGGTDDRSNLVSSCFRCNILKHTLDVRAFLAQYPFGSDLARNGRLRREPWSDERKRLEDIRDKQRLAYWTAWHGPRKPGSSWSLPMDLDS